MTAWPLHSGKLRFNRTHTAADFLVGCSLVGLMYIDVWRLLLSASTRNAFYLSYSPYHYLAAILAVLAGGAVMAILAALVRPAPQWVRYVASLLFLATIGIVINELRKSNQQMQPAIIGAWSKVGTFGLPVLSIIGVVVFLAAFRYAIPLARWYRRALLAASVFAAFLVVRGIWILGTMDFSSFHLLARNHHPGFPTAHRVVMVIFDEMDKEVAFDRRPSTLGLPNFDRLQQSAVTFDSTYSPGANTMASLPAYLLDRPVDSVSPLNARSFVAFLKDGRHLLSDTAKSIFSRPATQGARSALVGYALPYCRLPLAAMVDRCETIPLLSGGGDDVKNETIWSAALEQMQTLLPFNERRAHIARLRVVIDDAVDLAADSRYSLVLLHLPLPHAPWIWDPHTNQFSLHIVGGGQYLGNLALTDNVLGRIRDEMTRRGTWDTTTLIVTSDHAWRAKPTQVWGNDRRIPLLIKLPGKTQGMHVTTPTNSLVVSSLIPAFIGGEIPDGSALRLRVTHALASDSAIRSPSIATRKENVAGGN